MLGGLATGFLLERGIKALDRKRNIEDEGFFLVYSGEDFLRALLGALTFFFATGYASPDFASVPWGAIHAAPITHTAVIIPVLFAFNLTTCLEEFHLLDSRRMLHFELL